MPSGFRVMVEDRGDWDWSDCKTRKPTRCSRSWPETPPANSNLMSVLSSFTVKYPQMFVDINRDQVQTMGLNLGDVYDTLQIYLGSMYVNDFNLFGRTWQVVVQRKPSSATTLRRFAGSRSAMPSAIWRPLGTVADIRADQWAAGRAALQSLSRLPRSRAHGPPAVSSGEAIDAFEELAKTKLPQEHGTRMDGNHLLAAHGREHRDDNLRLGGAAGVSGVGGTIRELVVAVGDHPRRADVHVECDGQRRASTPHSRRPTEVNIFTQIGFVVLVGLASKNAVLIVEFAKHKLESGISIREATLAACRLRCGRS